MGTLDEGAGWLCRLGELSAPGGCAGCGCLKLSAPRHTSADADTSLLDSIAREAF